MSTPACDAVPFGYLGGVEAPAPFQPIGPRTFRSRLRPVDQRGESDPVTVVVVGDEALVRMGICSVLDGCGDTEIVGEAAGGQAAMELVRRHRPRVLVATLMVPAAPSLAIVELISQQSPATGVIVLAAEPREEVIFAALHAGVAGLLVTADVPAELADAVRAVARGDAALSPCITRRVLNRLVRIDLEAVARARSLIDTLTRRERQVLECLADGKGNAAIARGLFLSEGAVKSNVSRLLYKLECANRVEAATVLHRAQLLR